MSQSRTWKAATLFDGNLLRFDQSFSSRNSGEEHGLAWTLAKDYEHGFIKVKGGEIRDEPIDISKLSDDSKLTAVEPGLHLFCAKVFPALYI